MAGSLAAEGLHDGTGGCMSLRTGGVSLPPFDSLNLRPAGLRADASDDPAAIAENQRRYMTLLEGARPVWLDQVHGTTVVRLRGGGGEPWAQDAFERADASITTERGVACTVLVADCLPVLFSAPDGQGVGAAHAGWRGLAGGVLEATVAALCDAAGCVPGDLRAWLGACIGPDRFEVGDDVVAAFGASQRFRPGAKPGKWWADLPGLARDRLRAAGVSAVAGGTWCTVSDPGSFYSYRRDRLTGRHAASVWLRT